MERCGPDFVMASLGVVAARQLLAEGCARCVHCIVYATCEMNHACNWVLNKGAACVSFNLISFTYVSYSIDRLAMQWTTTPWGCAAQLWPLHFWDPWFFLSINLWNNDTRARPQLCRLVSCTVLSFEDFWCQGRTLGVRTHPSLKIKVPFLKR